MTSPLTKNANGTVSWDHTAGDKYLLIGTDRDGNKFQRSDSVFIRINCINAWQGKIYLVRDGKRHLIKTISN